EGVIPDVIAKRIVADVMAPRFKQGDFYGGINAAVDALTALVGGEGLPEPKRATGGDSAWEGALPLLLFGGLIVGAILRSVLGNFLGGVVNGGLIGAAVWILGGGLIVALVLAFIAFIITMSGGLGMFPGMGGGFGRGGGFGSGGFSGGGGGFGGGGASGDW
ncbi:MAG TPA: TPM domain-containing protein, partial [Methylophilaceae bacterium]|nr:TPM domain-containing protein [Methylophilaceae bacterium]